MTDSPSLRDRLEGALWGIFVGDALAMPVHWYYDPRDVVKDYGAIKGYVAPKGRHPTSVMADCETHDIVGRVILHGKQSLWGGPAEVHYHRGLKAGENTLNSLCARVALRSIAAAKGYSAKDFLERYVAFMTTPGSHDDSYCESFHRDFFEHYDQGVPPEQCRGEPDSETPQIGGLVMPIAVAVACAPLGREAAEARALEHLRLTHLSDTLEAYFRRWLEVFFATALEGKPLRGAVEAAGGPLDVDFAKLVSEAKSDVEVVYDAFGPACYIEDALPVLLYFAHKHAASFEDGLLANANVGGENCHRGSALGALLGAACGARALPPRLVEGLAAKDAIREEIRGALDATIASA